MASLHCKRGFVRHQSTKLMHTDISRDNAHSLDTRCSTVLGYCSVAISSFILAIAIAGFKPLGHVFEHCEKSQRCCTYHDAPVAVTCSRRKAITTLTLKMVWHRYSDMLFCIFSFLCGPYESCQRISLISCTRGRAYS